MTLYISLVCHAHIISSGSGDFNPEQLDNPVYGTSLTNGNGMGGSEEEAERNLENPVYGLPTDISYPTEPTEAIYATPHDVVVSHYDVDTTYNTPDADYYEIESTDATDSPLTIGHYDVAYGTMH